MLQTCKDLVVEFNCCAAYTESDEISLIFPESPPPKSPENPFYFIFGGRVTKMVTLAAGLCSGVIALEEFMNSCKHVSITIWQSNHKEVKAIR
jgi:tRNA(His) 5'-end guanylyltransferase